MERWKAKIAELNVLYLYYIEVIILADARLKFLQVYILIVNQH